MQHKAEIPYGAYWSTPFARWQGAFANLHSVEFAAHVTKAELARRKIPADVIDHGVLGISVPQKHAFYGLPWLAGMAGLDAHRRADADAGLRDRRARSCSPPRRKSMPGCREVSLTVTCDRTSNGPHLYYPNPRGPGGTGAHEDWVMDNFGCDPLGGHAMVQTAENVAAKHGSRPPSSTTSCCGARRSIARRWPTTAPFHKRFMTLPFEVPDPILPQDRRQRSPATKASGCRAPKAGQAQAGGRRRHGDLRRADASGRRQRRHDRRHGRSGRAN